MFLRHALFHIHTVSPISTFGKCVTTLKESRCWVIVHSTSLLWLVCGIITAIVLSQVPTIKSSHPLLLKGQDPIMAEIDIGLHPFWLSSVSFRIVHEDTSTLPCTVNLYVLENQTCGELPTVTQYFTDETLAGPPYYLLKGSLFNITIGKHISQLESERFTVWYVEGTIIPNNCADSDAWNCDFPPSSIYTCQIGVRGETLETYRANVSEFYTFCSNGLHGNSFVLEAITYNVTRIRREHAPPRAALSSTKPDPVTIHFSNSFDRSKTEYCMLLDIDIVRCNGASGVSYRLEVDVQRRLDFPLVAFFIGFAFFLLHLLITGLAHYCYQTRYNQTRYKTS